MTQDNGRPYPDPNQPPMYGYMPADPYGQQVPGPNLKMCRAAAVVQIAVGVCVCLMAFCVLAAGLMLSKGAIPPEQQGEISELTSEFGGHAGLILALAGMCVGLPGLSQLILGYFVWRGAKPGIIVSIVVNALFGGFMVLNLLALMSGAQNLFAACVNVLMLAVMVGLIVALVMAYRETSAAAASKAAYEAQWRQYYQQYQAGTYQPPAPPAPQPPAPPETRPPSDEAGGNPPPPPLPPPPAT